MYRPVDLIEVRAWGATIGGVSIDPGLGYYVFEYDPKWQARGIELAPLTMPVSQSLHVFPLLPEATYKRLPAMLADALPDDFGNALIDAWMAREGVTKSAITPLDRLAYLGARAKAVIAWNPETLEIRSGQLPADPGFDYWLLKLDGVGKDSELGTGGFYGRIEYAYYLMAKAAGIEMFESRLLEENDRAHFMTRRFDRQNGGKQHIQTLCAMQHLDFKQRATHDYNQYFQAIAALKLPAPALEEGFRRMVFNVLAANCDDHTKNLSFLMDESGQWQLAPAYDVTHAYNPKGEWTYQHLMSVNGKFQGITRADLAAVGDRFLIPGYRRIINTVGEAIGRWPEFADAAGLPPGEMARVRDDFPELA